MKKLGKTGMKWLKGFHLITVSCWIGGGVSLVLLYFLKSGISDGGVLHGIDRSIHYVDMSVVVIPGAFACLLTGLIYGIFTDYGFFRHGWIVFKWILTVAAILFGSFCLGPWETAMMKLSGKLGLSALADPDYLHNQFMHDVFGALQVLMLLITVFISIFKPWKNLRRREKRLLTDSRS